MSANPRQALYVSDLDGTLLRSDSTLSPYSVRTLNRLIGEGLRITVLPDPRRYWRSAAADSRCRSSP